MISFFFCILLILKCMDFSSVFYLQNAGYSEAKGKVNTAMLGMAHSGCAHAIGARQIRAPRKVQRQGEAPKEVTKSRCTGVLWLSCLAPALHSSWCVAAAQCWVAEGRQGCTDGVWPRIHRAAADCSISTPVNRREEEG